MAGPPQIPADVSFLAGPIGTPGQEPPGFDDAEATVEQAWWLYMQRIGKHNVALIKDGGRALDAIHTLRKSY